MIKVIFHSVLDFVKESVPNHSVDQHWKYHRCVSLLRLAVQALIFLSPNDQMRLIE